MPYTIVEEINSPQALTRYYVYNKHSKGLMSKKGLTYNKALAQLRAINIHEKHLYGERLFRPDSDIYPSFIDNVRRDVDEIEYYNNKAYHYNDIYKTAKDLNKRIVDGTGRTNRWDDEPMESVKLSHCSPIMYRGLVLNDDGLRVILKSGMIARYYYEKEQGDVPANDGKVVSDIIGHEIASDLSPYIPITEYSSIAGAFVRFRQIRQQKHREVFNITKELGFHGYVFVIAPLGSQAIHITDLKIPYHMRNLNKKDQLHRFFYDGDERLRIVDWSEWVIAGKINPKEIMGYYKIDFGDKAPCEWDKSILYSPAIVHPYHEIIENPNYPPRMWEFDKKSIEQMLLFYPDDKNRFAP